MIHSFSKLHLFSKRYIVQSIIRTNRIIYETNRKLTKFVMCAPVGSMSPVPLENGDKARKEFRKRMNHL
jgi:hypothetical protein